MEVSVHGIIVRLSYMLSMITNMLPSCTLTSNPIILTHLRMTQRTTGTMEVRMGFVIGQGLGVMVTRIRLHCTSRKPGA